MRMVRWMPKNNENEQWERERQDAIWFFDELTPAQEYDKHTAERERLKRLYEDELV